MTELRIPNWIDGKPYHSSTGAWLEKYCPHDGRLLSYVTDSTDEDVKLAVSTATAAQQAWAEYTPIRRGQILASIASMMHRRRDELAQCVAIETGKPSRDAISETDGAILQGEYFAGEGMRLYGRSLTSGTPNKYSHTVRQPRGVAGLIIPANTPIANIAWKTFPALICGNSVVLKGSEDSPQIASLFAQITKDAGLPDGVFNLIQGRGQQSGAALVMHKGVDVISFTGSTNVGRWIAEVAGKRLARVSLELGGKNPFVVCDDADLDQAVHWASLSAFSNAGQRCAAGSRILVFRSVYEEFRDRLVAKTRTLKLGISADSDLGPVISRRQHRSVLAAIERARADGGRILCGGKAADTSNLINGYYVEPTVIDSLSTLSEIACKEVFGPVVTLHMVENINEALAAANSSEYGLAAAIHTTNVDRAMWFAQRVKAGVANINMGTYGSEPHMPFGGFGASGNGTREPGVEALEVYSELKNISFLVRTTLLS